MMGFIDLTGVSDDDQPPPKMVRSERPARTAPDQQQRGTSQGTDFADLLLTELSKLGGDTVRRPLPPLIFVISIIGGEDSPK
jgi:hypothetical protein